MKSALELEHILRRIDRKSYKAYHDIQGTYDFERYALHIDRVQGDPFASPSGVRIRVPQDLARFPDETFSTRSREVAARDFVTRAFVRAAKKFSRGDRGTGRSGQIAMDRPGQEILERTSVLIDQGCIEARFTVGLPGFGRSVAAGEAMELFFEELPAIAKYSLYFENLDQKNLYEHIHGAEDADFLRSSLKELRLTAFIADGAILPRASGIDDRPLTKGKVIPWASPRSLQVAIELPHRGKITGTGIPEGITLITGGGYHGKSTVLRAIEVGIYTHIPGDGREFVVSDAGAMKIRAEDGRGIERVDISPFIANLPFGQDTGEFSSDNASGSTSQAANIIEALEAGAAVLLIDEDTSATNFMIRDHRMQELIAKEKEPITPFIDKVSQLCADLGISTILVMGGSGDYFEAAHHVLSMEDYSPRDVTAEAKAIAAKYRNERKPEGGARFGQITGRIPLPGSFDPSKGKREVKIKPGGVKSILFGEHRIDLSFVEQLADESQARAIGDAIYYATGYMDGKRTLKEIIDMVIGDIEEKGLPAIGMRLSGSYARFRGLELAAAINRLRTLSVKQRRTTPIQSTRPAAWPPL